MSWSGVGNSILDAFQGGPIAANQGRQRIQESKQRMEIDQQDALDRQRQHDFDLHKQLLEAGATPVFNGLTKRTMGTGPSAFQSDSPIPGVPGGGGIPEQMGSYIDRADPSRLISFKDHTGAPVSYELPTPIEQIHQSMARMITGRPLVEEQGRQEANLAAAKAGGEAKARADVAERNWVSLPPSVASLYDPSGHLDLQSLKIDPARISEVAQGAVATQEAPAKVAQAKLADASRRLGSVSTPQAYRIVYNTLPDDVKQQFDAPDQFEPVKSATRARMVGMTPEEQQKTSLMLNATPEEWNKSVDDVAPPTGRSKSLNTRTKVLVQSALRRGDFAKADAAIKDAADQLGRTETAVATAQATAPIKINLAGAETAARNNANMGGAPGGNGLNSAMEGIAQQVAGYQLNPTTALSRIPFVGRQALLNRVQEINPDFHQEYYNNFNKTETDATTGKIGTSANALNTMMGHLSVLNDAADALKNGNIQELNKLANFLGVQTGNSAVTTYNTIVHRLGPEVTKAYLASGGSVGERGTNEEDFDAKLGPDQIKANIGVSALLADSKIKALQDQYKRGTYGRGQQRLISDEADQARQRLTGQSPAALRGPSYKFTASGPNGHKIGSNDGKTWVDVQTGKPVQ